MASVRYSAARKAEALHQVGAMQDRGYSRRNAVLAVAAQLGCCTETLNAWLRRDAVHQRSRGMGQATRLRQLEREVDELLRANALLRAELEQLQRWARSGDGLGARSPAAEPDAAFTRTAGAR